MCLSKKNVAYRYTKRFVYFRSNNSAKIGWHVSECFLTPGYIPVYPPLTLNLCYSSFYSIAKHFFSRVDFLWFTLPGKT